MSRVGAGDLGKTVACPHCGRPFPAEDVDARRDEPPTIRPRRGWNPPAAPVPPKPVAVEPSLIDDGRLEFEDDTALPSGTLVGLALLPWAVPMLWLLLPMLTGKEPIFSFAAPTALAFGAFGLCLGVGFTAKWSHGTKVKVILAITVLTFVTGGLMFAVKKEWVEAVRRHFGRGELVWQPFTPPDRAYDVKFPGKPRHVETPLKDWNLAAFQYADEAHKTLDVFVVAHGPPPAAAGDADADWFETAKKAVVAASGGELRSERPLTNPGHPGREYVLSLGDGVTNRIVRVFRMRPLNKRDAKAFYLAAEGPFLAPTAPDVQLFFSSFSVK